MRRRLNAGTFSPDDARAVPANAHTAGGRIKVFLQPLCILRRAAGGNKLGTYPNRLLC